MLEKKKYANGQDVYLLQDERLTYYFKNGRIKSTGPFVDGQMEGEWTFYRESGQLWQVGNFRQNKKHGRWARYSREGLLEYDEEFRELDASK